MDLVPDLNTYVYYTFGKKIIVGFYFFFILCSIFDRLHEQYGTMTECNFIIYIVKEDNMTVKQTLE